MMEMIGTIALLVVLLRPSYGITPATSPEDYSVEGWLRRMSLEDKVGQMNYVPVRKVIKDVYTVSQ